ncbi:hypothetical protein WA158_002420 [Blastocystis sp. Blastoise]
MFQQKEKIVSKKFFGGLSNQMTSSRIKTGDLSHGLLMKSKVHAATELRSYTEKIYKEQMIASKNAATTVQVLNEKAFIQSQLQKAVVITKTENSKLQENINDKQHTITLLRDMLETLNNDGKKFKDILIKLLSRIDRIKESKVMITSILYTSMDTTKVYTIKKNHFDEVCNAYIKKLQILEESVKTSEKEKHTIEDHINKMKEDIETKEIEIRSMDQEYIDIEKQISAIQQQVNQHQNSLQSLEESLHEIESQIESETICIDQIQTEITKEKETIKNTIDIYVYKEEEEKKLYEDIQRENDIDRTALNSYEDSIHNTEDKLSRVQEETQKWVETENKIIHEYDELQSKYMQEEEAYCHQKEEMQSQKLDYEEKKKLLKQLEESILANTNELELLKEKKTTVVNDHNDHQSILEERHNSIKEIEQTKQKQENSLQTEKNILKELNNSLNEITGIYEEKTQIVSCCLKSIENEKDMEKQLKEKHDLLSKEIEKKKEKREDDDTTLDQLKEKNTKVLSDINTLKADIDRKKVEEEGLEEEKEKLMKIYDDLKMKANSLEDNSLANNDSDEMIQLCKDYNNRIEKEEQKRKELIKQIEDRYDIVTKNKQQELETIKISLENEISVYIESLKNSMEPLIVVDDSSIHSLPKTKTLSIRKRNKYSHSYTPLKSLSNKRITNTKSPSRIIQKPKKLAVIMEDEKKDDNDWFNDDLF